MQGTCKQIETNKPSNNEDVCLIFDILHTLVLASRQSSIQHSKSTYSSTSYILCIHI